MRWFTSSLPGIFDGFSCLLHYTIVRCDDQHHDVGHLRTPLPHGLEGRMTGRVQKCDDLAGWKLD